MTKEEEKKEKKEKENISEESSGKTCRELRWEERQKAKSKGE